MTPILDKPTKQQVFDHVAAHLLAQDCKSEFYLTEVTKHPTCAYRGNNGMKCAAGCLIADELYTPAMEGHAVGHVNEAYETPIHAAIEASLGYAPHQLPFDTWMMIRELQSLHDAFEPSFWLTALVDLAARHGVTFTPPAAQE